MDLRQMRLFLALAEERNFSRAAEKLHMTQPPLTRQIRALEEGMGVALFVRTAKGVDLTVAGQALLEEVPNVLSLARLAEERTLRAARGLGGKIEIGIFTASVLSVIPQLLARFHAQRPDVQIGLHTMSTPTCPSRAWRRRLPPPSSAPSCACAWSRRWRTC
jgi:DNA-binding transcriptional LysR family regulator